MRHLVFLIVLGVCGSGSAAPTPDWAEIKPAVTTESEVISAFGPPQEIVATFPWSEWSARWKIRPATSQYVLRYRTDGHSSVLNGPGGPADSVEVDVAGRLVISVRWHYGGPSAHAANELFRADPEMRFAAVDAPTYGSKGVANGVLLVEIGLGASQVTVSYELK